MNILRGDLGANHVWNGNASISTAAVDAGMGHGVATWPLIERMGGWAQTATMAVQQCKSCMAHAAEAW